jgi:hypothetical protein
VDKYGSVVRELCSTGTDLHTRTVQNLQTERDVIAIYVSVGLRDVGEYFPSTYVLHQVKLVGIRRSCWLTQIWAIMMQ